MLKCATGRRAYAVRNFHGRALETHAMKAGSQDEYCLIVEGPYLNASEAEHALRDPFIEDWVEQTGRFRVHNLQEMLVVPGVTLGQLGVEMLEERLFEIASQDPEHPLTEHKARGVAEALRRQDMFDEISVELRESFEDDGESAEDDDAAVDDDAAAVDDGELAGEADPS
jgi:hypothetical protein